MDIKISKRFPVKERHFLNIFLPVCICALVLEILALLVCIVVFAPLSDTVSNIFIFSIAITALLIFLVPFIMSFVSGCRGDKKQFRSKTSLENQTALESGKTVIESDAAIRNKYLRFPKILALLVCPSVFLLSGLALSLTKDYQASFSVRLLRLPFFSPGNSGAFCIYPTSNVLGKLLRYFPCPEDIPGPKQLSVFRLQREYGGTGGILICAYQSGAFSCGQTRHQHTR